jgi:GAF domain-containing protein
VARVDLSVGIDPPTEIMSPLSASARLSELQRSGLLKPAADHPLDQLARVASAIVDAPRSYVTLASDDGQVISGLAPEDAVERRQPLSASLCQFAMVTGEPLVVNDSERDQLVRHTDPVRNREVGAYAVIPLRTSAGHVLGALCVIDSRPREWKPREIDLLRDLAEIAIRDIQHRINEAQEACVRDLAAQLTQATLATEDALAPLVAVAAEQEEPRLQRFAALTRARMEQTLSTSKKLSSALAESQVQLGHVRSGEANLVQTVRRAARSTAAAGGTDEVTVHSTAAPLLVRCDPTALERAVNHLMVTAQQYATGDDPVELHLGVRGAEAELRLQAPGSRIPTVELTRVVARFCSATSGHSGDEDEEAAIRVVQGATVIRSGLVQARTAADGLQFRARWRLANFSSEHIIDSVSGGVSLN